MSSPPAFTPLHAASFEGQAGGKPTRLFTLRNGAGMCVSFCNLGGKILQIVVPDRQGKMDDVALGYDSLAGVVQGQASMGAFVGRFANRIAGARFTLDGQGHTLEPNSNGHSLHGGPSGSCHRVFDVVQCDDATAHLMLHYRSADDGFPGNVMSRVIYRVTDDNELVIHYDATTDSPTVVNMTSHVYFNLAGHNDTSAASLARHQLRVNASKYTPVRANQIPTGAIAPVEGTPFDFRRPRAIGERVEEAERDHEPHMGYDHNWVIDKPLGQMGLHAQLYEPESGRTLEVHSTEPGLVFFGGNNLQGATPRDVGKGGHVYRKRSGLCLEPGHFPDSPNHPNFPGTVLRPGEWFSGTIVYRFGVAMRARH